MRHCCFYPSELGCWKVASVTDLSQVFTGLLVFLRRSMAAIDLNRVTEQVARYACAGG